MNILAISDKVIDYLYGPGCRARFGHVDMVISCGDLPYYYLEFILNTLDKPMFYVRGNHANKIEYTRHGNLTGPRGAVDLHRRTSRHQGLLLAGVEGSLRYNRGDYQYTEGEMWSHVLRLIPGMLYNRLSTGRFLDVFITHAPPLGVHDKPDRAHNGIQAFAWLNRVFKPRYHLHGHIHRYHPNDPAQTRSGDTLVVNSYGHQELVIEGN
ncbi:MAG TPA: metallophosphoesterase [Anaerolineales bacterium]|nr:metallophosphoesterase [Anaerolineales bacterium]